MIYGDEKVRDEVWNNIQMAPKSDGVLETGENAACEHVHADRALTHSPQQ